MVHKVVHRVAAKFAIQVKAQGFWMEMLMLQEPTLRSSPSDSYILPGRHEIGTHTTHVRHLAGGHFTVVAQEVKEMII